MLRTRITFLQILAAAWTCNPALQAGQIVDRPFSGITTITRTEDAPRRVNLHVIEIDLNAPGIRFKLTPPSGALETVRQTTLDFLKLEHAQVAINGHFF